MKKTISAVIGEYQKDGQTKAEWADVGVILTSANGKEYMLLNAEVSLAGILAKQNVLAQNKGEQHRANVMCSINEEQSNQQQNNNQQQQQQGFNNNQNQQNNNNIQQGGYQNPHQGGFNNPQR